MKGHEVDSAIAMATSGITGRKVKTRFKVKAHMDSAPCGLYYTTREIMKYMERAGCEICIAKPGKDANIEYGTDTGIDVHSIHSQLSKADFFDRKPKFLWTHGEPISSVGNGFSMKAMVQLATQVDAFICMRKDEYPIWSAINRTYLVPKGVDLEVYKPLEVDAIKEEKLSGSPAVLYVENWRGNRNPLYLCAAMEKVWKRNPNARLHLFNCNDEKMVDMFKSLIGHTKWNMFVRTLSGSVGGPNEVNQLYNRADIVVSCLYPLYARGIEALAAGKAFIGPGYREPGYPWTCDLDVDSMADAIERCWGGYGDLNYRKWAEQNHDVKETVRQTIEIYERYL